MSHIVSRCFSSEKSPTIIRNNQAIPSTLRYSFDFGSDIFCRSLQWENFPKEKVLTQRNPQTQS